MLKLTRFLFVAVAMTIALSLAAQMDEADARAAAANYCDNVYNGIWPDYDNIYSEQCEKDDVKKN